MGIQDLMSLLRQQCPEVLKKSLSKEFNDIYVDTPLLVMACYKKAQVNGTPILIEEVLTSMHNKLKLLITGQIYYVFDGPTREAKKQTCQSRKESQEKSISRYVMTYEDLLERDLQLCENLKDPMNEPKEIIIPSCTTVCYPTYAEILQKSKDICAKLSTVLIAKHDSEEFIGFTMKKDDIALTIDSDALPFGCTTVLQNYGKENETWIQLSDVLEGLNLTMEQFRLLCVVLGNDFCPRIHKVGPISSLASIRLKRTLPEFANYHGAPEGWLEKAQEAFKIFSLECYN